LPWFVSAASDGHFVNVWAIEGMRGSPQFTHISEDDFRIIRDIDPLVVRVARAASAVADGGARSHLAEQV
jgi:hypothetical protein